MTNSGRRILISFSASAFTIALLVRVGDIVSVGMVANTVGASIARTMILVGFTSLSIAAVLHLQKREKDGAV
ncbi:hypothetical protein [Haladaptatus litoreus]|uniref:hypothetical protein n=1 Tax=Haladaptatus litoreus TaxID=553468 RepID=UPI0011156265|nr:hypothetical protein [Haladaptatus litoreus]